MKTNNTDDLLFYFSKLTIIIPLIIIIIALLIKFNQSRTSVLSDLQLRPTITLLPTKQLVSNSINLQGPFICQYKDKDIQANVSIKNKNIYAKILRNSKYENILINNDCYYRWEENKYTGEKICGISTIMSIVDTLINNNLLDINNLNENSMLKNLTNLTASDGAQINAIIKSCIKKPVDNNIFNIPQKILFKNSTIK